MSVRVQSLIPNTIAELAPVVVNARFGAAVPAVRVEPFAAPTPVLIRATRSCSAPNCSAPAARATLVVNEMLAGDRGGP